MPRSKAEIQADIDRLNGELGEAVDDEVEAAGELGEVLDEAQEAHDEAVDEAADEVADEVAEAVEDAAEAVAEDSPVVDTPAEAEDDITEQVIAKLCDRFDLTPKVPVDVVVDDDTALVAETVPQPEHWSRRRIW